MIGLFSDCSERVLACLLLEVVHDTEPGFIFNGLEEASASVVYLFSGLAYSCFGQQVQQKERKLATS
jgi:hypothetical protein